MKKIILLFGILIMFGGDTQSQNDYLENLSTKLTTMLYNYDIYFYEGSPIRDLFREDSIGLKWFGYDKEEAGYALYEGKTEKFSVILQILDFYVGDRLRCPDIQIIRRGINKDWPHENDTYDPNKNIIFELYNKKNDNSAILSFTTSNEKIEWVGLTLGQQ